MAKSPSEAPLFLDTSIQIARLVHSREAKKQIQDRITDHQRTVTGLVVRQEFKRRLLKEADYLLRSLHRLKSFDELYHHVIRLPAFLSRKRNICLHTLGQVYGKSDREKTDRLRLYLRSLLVDGMREFDQSVDTVTKVSGCGCAKHEVVEKEAFRKYDLGQDRCSRTRPSECGIVSFLANQKDVCARVLATLKSLPAEQKTDELTKAEQYLEGLAEQPEQAQAEDPCLTVGDLLIALESLGIASFYTLNSKESQHLCRVLGQTLIVHPIDPRKPEIVCRKDELNWPKFGK